MTNLAKCMVVNQAGGPSMGAKGLTGGSFELLRKAPTRESDPAGPLQLCQSLLPNWDWWDGRRGLHSWKS